MGRKGQKSQLQSGFALYEMSVMATKWNTLNECVCTGVTRKQSGVIFEECKLMLRGSVLAPKFKISRDKIVHIKSGSFLEALSKEAKKSGEGSNICLGIIDEFKDHPDLGFYEVIETGQKAQPQPLLIMISTAGNDISVPMYSVEYPYAEKILNRSIKNNSYFTVICEVEKGDDISDWRVWEKANQLLFTYDVGIKGLKDSYEIAKEVPSKMVTFLVKNLNMWQNKSNEGYLDMDKFAVQSVKEFPIDIFNRDVYIGIDVSAKIDLCGVSFMTPFINNDGLLCQCVENYSFIPNDEILTMHKRVDKQPFDAWRNEGHVILTNSPIVDQAQIIDFCKSKIREYNWKNVRWCIDPHNASLLTTTLIDEGYDVFEIFQSKKHLNEPTVALREQIYCNRIYFKENPCQTWQFGNAYVESDGELIKIDKKQQKKRIDNVDSTICAMKLAMYHKEEIDLNAEILSDEWYM